MNSGGHGGDGGGAAAKHHWDALRGGKGKVEMEGTPRLLVQCRPRNRSTSCLFFQNFIFAFHSFASSSVGKMNVGKSVALCIRRASLYFRPMAIDDAAFFDLPTALHNRRFAFNPGAAATA